MPFLKKKQETPIQTVPMESPLKDTESQLQQNLGILNQNNEILRTENQKLTKDKEELLGYLEALNYKKELGIQENFNYHLILNLQKISKSLNNIDARLLDLVRLEAQKQGLDVQE